MAQVRRVYHNGHRIEVDPSWATTPIEKVFYDGQEVSSKFSVFGQRHSFEVLEDGENAFYEVEIGATLRSMLFPDACVTVRRNGVILFTDK